MRRTTIVLADDHPMICAALRKLLEPDYEVIACVGDGRTLVKTALELNPDLVLVDVGLPLLNGLEAGRELMKLTPRVKLIFLTMNADPDIASEAFRIGASGYVIKSAMGEELLPAIQSAMQAAC
jgi:DNA-binding NarL/FixJ family response regulator